MFVLTLLLALPALFQNTNVTVQPDMRLFTTMAALNAAGFDVEFASEYHPVRQAVRKYAAELDGDLLTRLRDFYSSHIAALISRPPINRSMTRNLRNTYRWQSASPMHRLSNR